MHKIVEDFINTNERLSIILEKHHNPNEFFESVFCKLGKGINIEIVEPSLYEDLDRAIIFGHTDPELYLLFISFAIPFTSMRFQLERARVMMSVGESISQEDLHPILKAYYILAKATLYAHELNSVMSNQLLKESLALADRQSKRYKTIMIGVATMISLEGRLADLPNEDLELLENHENSNVESVTINLKISNCIYTGKFREGFLLLEKLQKKLHGEFETLQTNSRSLLNILSRDFDPNHYEMEYFKNYVVAYQYLLEGKYELARNLCKAIESDINKFNINILFRFYLPLHIELSEKNRGKARFLYSEMLSNYGPSYMDDFFLARLFLLEGEKEKAKFIFARLIENTKKYDAINRLHFEMQFAKEISASDLLYLLHGTENENVKNDDQVHKQIDNQENTQTSENFKLIGNSKSLKQVKLLIKKFSQISEPVLITGETGTGKELIAHAIHNHGLHATEPFLAINCAALTETLLESELFGYEAGAFTGAQKERAGIFEAAGKGTVFLDEFGDISQKLQSSLLRILESKEIRLIGGTKNRTINCKIIVATNSNLSQAVDEKKFREDLYFRLKRFDIKTPPLRERKEDLPELIEYFLNRGKVNAVNKIVVTENLLELLMKYDWPGNIRELKNEMERLQILNPDKNILDVSDFDFEHLKIQNFQRRTPEILDSEKSLPKNPSQQDNEESRILKILNASNKTEKRHEYMRELFEKYKKLSRRQLIEILKISSLTATNDLKELCSQGHIEKIKPTKSVRSHYFQLKQIK